MSNRVGSRVIVFGVTIDYQLRYHDGLYQRLADKGWEVHLVSGPGPIGERIGDYPGIELHVIKMARNPHPFRDFLSLLRWIVLLARLSPQVTVVGTPKAGLLGGIAAKFTGVTLRLYELHGLRLEGAAGVMRKILRIVERIACGASNIVISVGHSLRQVAVSEKLCPASKIIVLGAGSPNGVDVDRFATASSDSELYDGTRAALELAPEEQVIVFIGRLTADKGVETLAEAMAKVSGSVSPQLVIVGAVDDESGLHGASLLRDATEKITFVGATEDVAPYLAIADVLCLPSRREGLPTVILEAFAAQVAVVATNATGIVDLVRSGQTGVLVEVDSGKELADALEKALTDHELRNQITENALRFVQENYRSDKVQGSWIEMLEKQTS